MCTMNEDVAPTILLSIPSLDREECPLLYVASSRLGGSGGVFLVGVDLL